MATRAANTSVNKSNTSGAKADEPAPKKKSCKCGDSKETKSLNDPDDYVSNWGPELCIAEGTQGDYGKNCNGKAIATKAWSMGKPPRGFSIPVPTVSARRVQVIQAQLQGTAEEIRGALPGDSTIKSEISMASRTTTRVTLSASRVSRNYSSRISQR